MVGTGMAALTGSPGKRRHSGRTKKNREIRIACRTISFSSLMLETGTGKEFIAEAIDKSSDRSSGRCIEVNCAASPSRLLESELFDHERGAYIGAQWTV
jgi:transcriptional regulator with PAS, ATPase and Fis domain